MNRRGGHSQRPYEVNFREAGIEFRCPLAPVRFPLSTNSPATLSTLMADGAAWSTVAELWDEGLLAERAPGVWVAPYTIIEHLASTDASLLDALRVPTPDTNVRLSVYSRGSVADDAFHVYVELEHPAFGTIREGDYPRVGPAFLIGRSEILPLTAPQRILLDTVKSAVAAKATAEDRMLLVASIKAAAGAAGAKLDQYLETEDYVLGSDMSLIPEEVGPTEIQLVPKFAEAPELTSEEAVKLLAEAPPTVVTHFGPGRRRKRVVVDGSLKEKIRKLPKSGRVTGPDVPRLLTNPEQIVPEGFDLSLFSERVKGIKTRVYNSRPYLHITKAKESGWFDGVPEISVEDISPASGLGDDSDSLGQISPGTYRELLHKAQESGSEFVEHEGAWIQVDPRDAERFDEAVRNLKVQDDGTYRIPSGSILEIYDNLESLGFVDTAEDLATAAIDGKATLDVAPPVGLKAELFPYQLFGYRWLAGLEKRLAGGLLADDMGLGKTIQVISHMLRLKEEGTKGPHLVVVPKTLLVNWSREIQTFTSGALTIYLYDGPNRHFHKDLIAGYDVILTTYDTLRRDQARLATIDWHMVVCDEAQYAKNPTAQRTSAVKALKARHRAALSGTPVENGLIEFWCIMDFVQPGLLGSWKDFRTRFERPIVDGGEDERELRVGQLLSIVDKYYLRRTKAEVLSGLPGKSSVPYPVGLGEDQEKLYRLVAAAGRQGGRGAALGAITRLLLLSAHPGTVADHLGRTYHPGVCPKLDTTLEILEAVRSKQEKAILFTDYKQVQRIVRDAIRERFGLWPDIINGDLTANRQAVVDVFSQKPGFNVLILGHQVAGVGLNIVAANHVIHYTRPWNPAKENQATDRVHRIGQLKPVTVHLPIVTEGTGFRTVEDRLDEILRSKLGLATDVLRPSAELTASREDLLDCLQTVPAP